MSTPGRRLRRPVLRPARGHRRPRSPPSGRNPDWLGRTPRTRRVRAPYPANVPASRSTYLEALEPGNGTRPRQGDPHRAWLVSGLEDRNAPLDAAGPVRPNEACGPRAPTVRSTPTLPAPGRAA